MEQVNGVIPNLARSIIGSIWAGADWVTERVISYAEAVVRAFIQTILFAILPAILCAKLGFYFGISFGPKLGMALGGAGLVYFAIVSSPGRWFFEWLSIQSESVRREVNKLSQILMTVIVVVLYIGLNDPIANPGPFWAFVVVLGILYVCQVIPGENWLSKFLQKDYVWLIAGLVFLMTLSRVLPESVTYRFWNSHAIEIASGTTPVEIPFRIDEQDQIIDLTTNQPMEIFQRVHREGEEPEPLKGWTKDKKGSYHIWTWFKKQGNSTPAGQEITAFSRAKYEDVVIETKRLNEQKIADAQKLVDDQKAKADAETARLKAEEDRKAMVAKAEEERRLQEQRRIEEAKRAARDQATYDQRKPVAQPQPQTQPQLVSVNSTILAPADRGQGIVPVRPSQPFTYQGQTINPEQSAVLLTITDVRETADKDTYDVILQPQTLLSDGLEYDIKKQCEPIKISAEKDSRNFLKIGLGAVGGAVAGAIIGGKKGALIGVAVGAAVGSAYVMSSHDKKFKLKVGDPVPVIKIRPK